MSKKLISSLLMKKHRDKTGMFVVEGQKFVSDIPSSIKVEFYACTQAFIDKTKYDFRKNTRIYIYEEAIFEKLCDTVTPQGVLAVCQKPEYNINDTLCEIDRDTFVVVEGLKDPGNLGTIIRTAASAGVKALFVTDNTVDLYNPKVLRSTMGAIFRLPVFSVDSDIYAKLKEKGVMLVSTSPAADEIYYEAELNGSIAIIVGHESKGVSKMAATISDISVSIPVHNGCESLNAAVAASIIIYEAFRQKSIYVG